MKRKSPSSPSKIKLKNSPRVRKEQSTSSPHMQPVVLLSKDIIDITEDDVLLDESPLSLQSKGSGVILIF